jgi:CRP-like cAMP-binding protein
VDDRSWSQDTLLRDGLMPVTRFGARRGLRDVGARNNGNGAAQAVPPEASAGGRGRSQRSGLRDVDAAFVAARQPLSVTNVLAQSQHLKAGLCEMLLFRNVSEEDFERFYSLLSWRRVATGARLLGDGERSPWVFLLFGGTAKVHQESIDGAQVIYSICGAGEILGELSAVDGEGHSATVTMLEPSVVAAIDRDEFVAFLLSVPQMSLNLSAITSRRLRAATDRIQSLSRLDVTGRLAAQLLLFARHYGYPTSLKSPSKARAASGTSVPPPAGVAAQNSAGAAAPTAAGAAMGVAIGLHLRQSDLADLIGASRVRVNQSLHGLRRSGLIDLDQNRITLIDMDGLRARCQ